MNRISILILLRIFVFRVEATPPQQRNSGCDVCQSLNSLNLLLKNASSNLPKFSSWIHRQKTLPIRGDGICDNQRFGCDPDSAYPCCAPSGWCGNSADHCLCPNGCVDYKRRKELISVETNLMQNFDKELQAIRSFVDDACNDKVRPENDVDDKRADDTFTANFLRPDRDATPVKGATHNNNEGNESLALVGFGVNSESRFRLIEDALDWNSAENYCRMHGGHLASFSSLDDWMKIGEELFKIFHAWGAHIWIGARRMGDSFVWSDGGAFKFSHRKWGGVAPWISGSPSDDVMASACVWVWVESVYASADHAWVDDFCYAPNLKPFLCEF